LKEKRMPDLQVAEPSPVPLPTTAAPASDTGRFPRRALLLTELTRNLPEQHGFVPLRVEGELPPDLRGTIVRNGPGVFERLGVRVAHTFEGDGAITAVRLDGETAVGACRVTASAGLGEELAANKVLYGTRAPWHRRVANAWRGRDKNTANTSVMTWQGKLLALMEAARPTELSLDGDDIHTIGETDLGGVVGPAFSAHPHRVAARRATYNFGVRYGRKPAIDLYELPDGGPARKLGSLPLDFNPMLHDFIATEHHLVFFLSPVALSVPRMMLQIGEFPSMWKWRPERGTEVIAVPIAAPDRAVRFPVDAFYQWHFVNAWSRSPSEIVVDYIHYPNFDSFDALSGARPPRAEDLDGRLHRAVIDLGTPRLVTEPRWDRACEFPRIHPAREGSLHQLTWVAADDLRTIARIDGAGRVEIADFGDSAMVSEPIVVPRSSGDEADAWILTLVHDRDLDRSHLAILDGLRLGDGPVARCWFDHFVPVTFHGTWIDAVVP
jgi:all-trans-8'-apo-beta-carotenal 15,15'-oxygenase